MIPLTGEIVWTACQPVIKVLVVMGVGYLLSRKGVIKPEGSKTIATALVWVFYPSLLFANVVAAINSDNFSTFGIMTLASIVNIGVGLVVGNIMLYLLRPPIEFRYGTVLSICMGNHGDVPLAIILGLGDLPPFNQGDSIKGVAYVSAFLFFTNLFFFSAGYTLFGQDMKHIVIKEEEQARLQQQQNINQAEPGGATLTQLKEGSMKDSIATTTTPPAILSPRSLRHRSRQASRASSSHSSKVYPDPHPASLSGSHHGVQQVLAVLNESSTDIGRKSQSAWAVMESEGLSSGGGGGAADGKTNNNAVAGEVAVAVDSHEPSLKSGMGVTQGGSGGYLKPAAAGTEMKSHLLRPTVRRKMSLASTLSHSYVGRHLQSIANASARASVVHISMGGGGSGGVEPRMELEQAVFRRSRPASMFGQPVSQPLSQADSGTMDPGSHGKLMGSQESHSMPKHGESGVTNGENGKDTEKGQVDDEVDEEHGKAFTCFGRSFFLEDIIFWIKSLFTLSNISSIIGLFIAAIPALHNLFQPDPRNKAATSKPPLLFVYNILTFMGNVAVPLSLINLGAALGRLKAGTFLPRRVLVGVTLTRLILLPAIGLALIQMLVVNGWIDSDNLMLRFVLMLEVCMPTASSTVFFTQLWHPRGEADGISSVILVEYSLVMVTITLSLAVILSIVST